ncbi:MAG: hypothetical protein M1813_009774 [Trichoglossum hirsutum]|nr:MAG: hypothetical protein M1813_009774 [Trichoglossum hirsutum]
MASHASPTTAQRQPPPSLFLGPPSHNSSRTSLPSLLVPGAHASAVANPAQSRVPLLRNRSSRNAPPTANTPASPAGIPSSSNNSNPTATIAAAAAAVAATVPPTRHSQSTQQPQPPQSSTRLPTPRHLTRSRTSILWAEMQATLEEVELSASRTTHLFGAAHSSALSRLRASQIALAQAWARSEAVEDTTASLLASPSDPHAPNSNDTTNPTEESPTSRTEPPPSSNDPHPSPPPSQSKLEAYTENDVLLARQHREANDLFFQRVNSGVLDVVARLEDVAVAMREVEQESRDIWNDSSDGGESADEGGGASGGAG